MEILQEKGKWQIMGSIIINSELMAMSVDEFIRLMNAKTNWSLVYNPEGVMGCLF